LNEIQRENAANEKKDEENFKDNRSFRRSLEFETSSARAIYANVEIAKKQDEASGVTATFYAR